MTAKVIPLRPDLMRVRDLIDLTHRSTAAGFAIPVWFTTAAYTATRDRIEDVLWAAFFAAAAMRDTDRRTIDTATGPLLVRFEYNADAEQMLVVMTPEEE